MYLQLGKLLERQSRAPWGCHRLSALARDASGIAVLPGGPRVAMGAAASNSDSRSEYVKYVHDGACSPAQDRQRASEVKREMKEHFMRARASGMDGVQLFEHVASLTEQRLASPGMAGSGSRRKFNYPGHTLYNSDPIDSRAASREVYFRRRPVPFASRVRRSSSAGPVARRPRLRRNGRLRHQPGLARERRLTPRR